MKYFDLCHIYTQSAEPLLPPLSFNSRFYFIKFATFFECEHNFRVSLLRSSCSVCDFFAAENCFLVDKSLTKQHENDTIESILYEHNERTRRNCCEIHHFPCIFG